MKIRDIMTSAPSYCTPTSTAEMAATLMRQMDTGILPVIRDPMNLELLGVVTDRDLCLKVVAARRDPAHTWIRDCMTANPVCCLPEDDVNKAVALMSEHRVRRIPVVDREGHIRGMLSLADIVRAKAVEEKTIAQTLTRICEGKPFMRESAKAA